MSEYNSQNILFVVNPIAGGNESRDVWEEVRQCLVRNKVDFGQNVYTTTGDGDEAAVADMINTHKPDKVVAVGGDGTIKMVAGLLLGKDIPLGIVPTGSANGMAVELNLPLDIDNAVPTILNGVVKYMDIIRINDNDICIHLSDIGMNAQIVKYYEENNWRGKLGYLRGAVKMMLKKEQMQLTIRRDDEEIVRVAYMVVLANARKYGTKAIINPEGSVFDGVFEIVIIRRWSLWEIVKTFFTFMKNDSLIIETLPAKSVEISVKKNIYFQVDGEYMGKHKSVCAKVEKGALPILLPKK